MYIYICIDIVIEYHILTRLNSFYRVFRVYAHIFCTHFQAVKEAQDKNDLLAKRFPVDFFRSFSQSFKHFIFFVMEFELIPKKEELEPLAPLIESYGLQLFKESPLMTAVRTGVWTEEAKRELGAPINLSENEIAMGYSYLIKASADGVKEAVMNLLAAKCQVNETNKNIRTALHFAIENGHNEVATLLLDHHAKCNVKDEVGITPLMIACRKGDLASTKILIKNSANVDEKDLESKTAVMYACEKGKIVNIICIISLMYIMYTKL